MTTVLALLALLALLVARIALDFFDVPKSLIALFGHTTNRMKPRVGCVAATGWLLLAASIAFLVFAVVHGLTAK